MKELLFRGVVLEIRMKIGRLVPGIQLGSDTQRTPCHASPGLRRYLRSRRVGCTHQGVESERVAESASKGWIISHPLKLYRV